MKTQQPIFMRIPFIPLLASAVSGILIGEFVIDIDLALIAATLFFVTTFFTLLFKLDRLKKPAFLITLMFVFSLYYTYTKTADINQQNLFPQNAKSPILARGFLLDVPLPLNYSNNGEDAADYDDLDEYFEFEYSLSDLYCFRFQVSEYSDSQNSIKCDETILIFSKNGYPELPVNRKIEIPLKVYLPAKPQNPGEFDFAKYQRELGIMRYASYNYDHSFKKIDSNIFEKLSINRFATNVRASITKLAMKLPSRDSSLFLTLTIGNSTMLTRETRDVFRLTGTLHLLVISGLHIGFLVLICELLLRLLHVNLRTKAVILIFLLIFYWLIVGYKISITRAVVIGILYYVGQLFLRRISYPNILAAAAFFILVINPYELFHIGFYLSFSAVFFIAFLVIDLNRILVFRDESVYFLTKLQKLKYFSRDYVLKSIKLSLAGFIGTSPIIWWKFGILTPGAFVSNLFAIPLMLWILGFSMIVFTLQIFLTIINTVLFNFGYEIFFTDFVNSLSLYLTKASCLGIDILLRIEKMIIKIPGCYYFVPHLSFVSTFLIYLFLVLIVFRRRLKFSLKSFTVVFSFVVIFLTFELFWTMNSEGNFTFTQQSGRFSSCSIMQTKNDETIIIDPGTLEYKSNGRRLVNVLNYKDVKSIDILIIQANRLNAIDGYSYILNQFRIKRVLFTEDFRKSFVGEILIEQLEDRNIAYNVISAGSRVTGLQDVSVQFISPPVSYQEELNVKYIPKFTVSTLISGAFGSIFIAGYSSDINYDANINFIEKNKISTKNTKFLILPARLSKNLLFDRWLKLFSPETIITSSHTKISDDNRALIAKNSEAFYETVNSGAVTYTYSYETKEETIKTFN